MGMISGSLPEENEQLVEVIGHENLNLRVPRTWNPDGKFDLDTPTTCTGGMISPNSMYSSFSGQNPFFPNNIGNDASSEYGSQRSAGNVMFLAKSVDKHFAKIYEERIRAMVK